jgi:hypothetical protein
MIHARSFALAIVSAVALSACGDSYADAFGTGGAPEAVPTASAGAAVDSGAIVPHDKILACPDRRPDENSPCAAPGAACEYGSSPDPACNATIACTSTLDGSSAWTRRPSGPASCSAGECPSGSTASIAGKPCDAPHVDGGAPRPADELVCTMSDGTCACTTGPDATHEHARVWVCSTPRPPCPVRRPLAGEACGERLSCDYGSCDWKRGVRMECSDGVWLTGGGTCS